MSLIFTDFFHNHIKDQKIFTYELFSSSDGVEGLVGINIGNLTTLVSTNVSNSHIEESLTMAFDLSCLRIPYNTIVF